jgi:hypothetical protein
MSSRKDDDSTDRPDSFPAPDEESFPDWPPDDKGATRGYGNGLPAAYTELQGDVRKGQKPPTERD